MSKSGKWGPAEIVEWGGKTWRRWPKAPSTSARNYFQRAGVYLHRAVWAAANGTIPDGFHVHHKDGNTADNAIENLELVAASEHVGEHQREYSKTHRHVKLAALEKATTAARDWHKSPDGLAWHRVNAKRLAAAVKPKLLACVVCLAPFSSKRGDAKFCGGACYARDWRAKQRAYKRAQAAIRGVG